MCCAMSTSLRKRDDIEKYVAFLTRRGRVVLAATALAMVAALVGIFRLEIQTEFDVFMPPESQFLEAMNQTSESFGDSGQLLVLTEIGRTEAGPDVDLLKGLPEIAGDLSEIDGVQSAQSPIPPSLSGLSGQEFNDALEQLQVLTGGGSIPIYVVFPAERELDPELAGAILRLQDLTGAAEDSWMVSSRRTERVAPYSSSRIWTVRPFRSFKISPRRSRTRPAFSSSRLVQPSS